MQNSELIYLIELICDLNNDIFQATTNDNTLFLFSIESDGNCTILRYGNQIIWDSEGDYDRKYNEETHCYEPWTVYIKREVESIKKSSALCFKAVLNSQFLK